MKEISRREYDGLKIIYNKHYVRMKVRFFSQIGESISGVVSPTVKEGRISIICCCDFTTFKMARKPVKLQKENSAGCAG